MRNHVTRGKESLNFVCFAYMPIHNSEETGFILLSSNFIDIYTVYKQILTTPLNIQISLLKCILIGDK